ncbi:MAG: hypothetical protein SFV54_20955 [Bryobacteraceae bacterium]|nr:hypothetical protein [Bryobacteraceae bacterium]
MSLSRRLELAKEVRELSAKLPFLSADSGLEGKIESAVVSAEVDHLYMKWGLRSIAGLEIDGRPATGAMLLEDGPEELCREVLDAIRKEWGLTEDERKN